MNGQGSPICVFLRCCLLQHATVWLAIVGCCAHVEAATSDLLQLRLQIAWGGGSTPRLWKGSIAVVGGTVSNIQLLGLDADQPGSFVEQAGRVLVYPRFASQTSGLMVDVSGPPHAQLEVVLTSDGLDAPTDPLRVQLADLRSEFVGEPRVLADDHKLRVARVASDKLRVHFERDTLVFSPRERARFDIQPHLLEAKPGSVLRARLRLRRADADRNDVTDLWPLESDLWARDVALKVDDLGNTQPITGVELPVPDEEGVYNITIDVERSLPRVGTVARRTVQFVVIDPRQPPLFGGGPPTNVTEFNPADPKWFERLPQLPQWGILQQAKRGQWSNLAPEATHLQGKSWTRVAGNGWVAYSLPVSDPHMPHVLELELPPGVSQDVGVSILDHDGSEDHPPSSLDIGVSLGDPDLMLLNVALPAAAAKHRVVFWPKSRSAILVISNRHADQSILFGRIRVEAFRQGLPVADLGSTATRKRIAVFRGGGLKDLFFAKQAHNSQTRTYFDDWKTFYQAGTRLIEYLRYAGYDGVVLTVAGEGSTLYPSKYLYPTPRYDRGVFSVTEQDAMRKDVVEMLFRLFDREGLSLVPAIEFATPLPELEKVLASRKEHLGVELIDARGAYGSNIKSKIPGAAPYYNPLNARVQAEMARVVREVVLRYRGHESFVGVGVPLIASGYTQLPGANWAVDSNTLQDFAGDVYDSSSISHEDLAIQLRRDVSSHRPSKLKNNWLAWRADQVRSFYKKLAGVVSTDGSGDLLYLSLADVPNSEPWQRHLRPALSQKSTVTDALLELGIDTGAISSDSRIVLLRPQQVAPLSDLSSQAMNFDINASDADALWGSNPHGAAEFHHKMQKVSFDSIDELGPVTARRKKSADLQFARAGSLARRPFALSLAQHDDLAVFEGGSSVPMGQETAVARFFEVFRQLPNRPFETLRLEGSSPLVLRASADQLETYMYAVNASPWTARASIQWRGAEGLCGIGIRNQQCRSKRTPRPLNR